MSSAIGVVDQIEAEFYGALGERVRQIRRKRNLSQETLAQHLGLARSSVANLESGRQHPPIYVLTLLAQALDVSEADLLPSRRERPFLDTDRLEQRLQELDEHQQHMIRSTARAAGFSLSDA